jgi:hypothetical protein
MEDQDDIEQMDDSDGGEHVNELPGFGSSGLGGGDPIP